MKYFSYDKTKEENKAEYRRLCLKLHPDVSRLGNDPFIAMKAEWEEYNKTTDDNGTPIIEIKTKMRKSDFEVWNDFKAAAKDPTPDPGWEELHKIFEPAIQNLEKKRKNNNSLFATMANSFLKEEDLSLADVIKGIYKAAKKQKP